MPTPADASAASILRRPGSGRYPERTLDYEGISNSKTLEVSNPETFGNFGQRVGAPPANSKKTRSFIRLKSVALALLQSALATFRTPPSLPLNSFNLGPQLCPHCRSAARHRYPAAAVATQDRRSSAAAGRACLRRPPVHVEVPRGYGFQSNITDVPCGTVRTRGSLLPAARGAS